MSVLVDESTVVLELLDEGVSCERCDTRATVAAVCRGCRKNVILCAKHYQVMREHLDDPRVRVYCRTCGASAWDFDDLIETVDL